MFFYQQRISQITLILRDVRVICCSPLHPVHLVHPVIIFFCVSFVSSVVFFINIGCHGFYGFFRFRFRFRFRYRFLFRFRYRFRFRFRFRFSLSPIQELGPGATPCRGGRCAARYPHGPPAAANKNTVDYDVVPAGGVEPPQGHAGHGMG